MGEGIEGEGKGKGVKTGGGSVVQRDGGYGRLYVKGKVRKFRGRKTV